MRSSTCYGGRSLSLSLSFKLAISVVSCELGGFPLHGSPEHMISRERQRAKRSFVVSVMGRSEVVGEQRRREGEVALRCG